jgi:cobalt/nickel transport system permease protein
MHISEGVLSGPVLGVGIALAAVGTTIGLKRLDYDRITKAGVLSAAFFVASLVHVPVGPSSVHLILNGLVGLLMGWGAFPIILVGLTLQAFFFQFGGITTLGVNTVIMALPGVICYLSFGRLIWKSSLITGIAAFACGFLAVLLSAVLVALSLVFTEHNFLKIAQLVAAAHLPIMVIEGIITLFCVFFLKKVAPEMLPGYDSTHPSGEIG